MNMDKIMKQVGQINLMLVGKPQPFTAADKAKWVTEHCTHTKRKGTGRYDVRVAEAACRPCIANAIIQYEAHAAMLAKERACAVICPRCEADPVTFQTAGQPRTSHRVFPKKRRPPYQNDWKEVRCLAAPIHAAWDRYLNPPK